MEFIDDSFPENVYDEETSQRIKDALEGIVSKAKSNKCVCCDHELKMDVVNMYDHSSGWIILPELPRQWLSIHCDNCNYDVSLNKLGIGR